MKKTLLLLFILTLFNTNAQNYYMATPQGYGAAATGGTLTTPVTVSTYLTLKNALTSTSVANSVILVSGTIDCLYMSVLMTNKTIIGLPGARLRNTQLTMGSPLSSTYCTLHPTDCTTTANNSGILNIKTGSNNVIIRNLIFEGPGAFDVDGRDLLTNEGTNVWVDHCEFQDGMDGNFDNKGTADNTTVSWCKFTYLKAAIAGGSGGSNDHRFSNLVGSANDDFPADGQYSITFQNCFWASGCKERMPRARNAQLHVLSCYYNVGTTSSKAFGLGDGNNTTTLYSQNNNFFNVTTKYANYGGPGTIALTSTNCLSAPANVGTAVPAPTYTTTPIPVAEVASYLTDATCGAGATLQVTAAGVVSGSNCTFLGTEYFSNSNDVKFYTEDNFLNIDFTNVEVYQSQLNIYSLTGQKVMKYNNDNLNNQNLKINIENLTNGIYICALKYNDVETHFKFIK